jgi:hypothetical protein
MKEGQNNVSHGVLGHLASVSKKWLLRGRWPDRDLLRNLNNEILRQ